jgi:starvation-inducible DNA-binding protein
MTIKLNTGLASEARGEIAGSLTKVLADSYALYLKTHGYHWNVRGANFSELHALFMAQYTEMWTALDELAERIRALGEFAPQGYSAFANLTGIKDGDPEKDSPAMLKELLEDHETVIASLRDAISVAEESKDPTSVDLLTQRLAAHEKHAWMIRATLGSR